MSFFSPVQQERLRALPLGVLLLACANPAQGAPSDPLHVLAGIGYFHDYNLFRLSPEYPGFAERRSDSAHYATAILLFAKQRRRQRLKREGKLSKVKFAHFHQLDYDAKDLLGLLNWQVGNYWEGKAGASYAQTLAPYTDLNSRERNLRVHSRVRADAARLIPPRWRLRDRYTYDLPLHRVNNRTETAFEGGVDYLAPSGSTAGLVLRRGRGKYLVARIAGRPSDDFTQDELKAKVHWKVTSITGGGRGRHRTGAAARTRPGRQRGTSRPAGRATGRRLAGGPGLSGVVPRAAGAGRPVAAGARAVRAPPGEP